MRAGLANLLLTVKQTRSRGRFTAPELAALAALAIFILSCWVLL